MKTTSRNHYDFIIYGATLEGLLLGNYLYKKGLKALILEPSDRAGQFFSSVSPASGEEEIPSLFTNVACEDETLKLLNWIRNNLELNVEGNEVTTTQTTLPPVTFEKGAFEPFVGFGENAPKESEFLQSFGATKKIEITPSVSHWMKHIQSSGVEIQYNSNLTNIMVEGPRVAKLTVNNKTDYSAENYIFCQNPVNLVPFLDPTSSENKNTSQKLISRLSKTEHWSTLQLSLIHNTQVSEKKEIHFLYGTQKAPIVSVGQFSGRCSQWISFISPDVIDISEEGVQIIKEMKRQIKRAYPEAFDGIVFEKIALWPKTHGYIDLKSKNFGQLEGIENLCVCSSHLIEGTNPMVGALKACQHTVELLSGLLNQAMGEAQLDHSSPEQIANP